MNTNTSENKQGMEPVKDKESAKFEQVLKKIEHLNFIIEKLEKMEFFIKNGYELANEPKNDEKQCEPDVPYSLNLLLKEGPQMLDYYTENIVKRIFDIEELLFY